MKRLNLAAALTDILSSWLMLAIIDKNYADDDSLPCRDTARTLSYVCKVINFALFKSNRQYLDRMCSRALDNLISGLRDEDELFLFSDRLEVISWLLVSIKPTKMHPEVNKRLVLLDKLQFELLYGEGDE